MARTLRQNKDRADQSVRRVTFFLPQQRDTDLDQLSARELECARLVAKGFSNKEVAQILHISHWTVATHLKTTYIKMGISRRTKLAYIMREIL